jgi:hypothetical protein
MTSTACAGEVLRHHSMLGRPWRKRPSASARFGTRSRDGGLADVRKLGAARKGARLEERRTVLKKLTRRVVVCAGEALEITWIPAEELFTASSNSL